MVGPHDRASVRDRALLLDFYGELLTEKQRRFCELCWNEDWSLAEIAQAEGLTRQGVWDILRRAEAKLRGVEDKTGIIRRWLDRRDQIGAIRTELERVLPDDDVSREILRKLDGLI